MEMMNYSVKRRKLMKKNDSVYESIVEEIVKKERRKDN